jgi:colanic acid/amylovoran biosynthesis glycosyltransferase
MIPGADPLGRAADPIRLIQSAPSWLPQTQTWMFEQLRALPREFESHVVCEVTENLDQFSMAHIHSHASLPIWRQLWDKRLRAARLRPYLSHLPDLAGRLQAPILHSHFGDTGWADRNVARRLGMRHIVTFYGYDLSYLPRIDVRWRDRYAELFSDVDLVLCEGSHMAASLEALGCPRDRLRVQHIGIDNQRFAFRPRRREQHEPLRVLIAASFTEKKGIPLALEALARIDGSVPLEVTLIGDSSGGRRNDAEKARILRAIDTLGFSQKIRWLGYQPHAALLREAYDHHVFLAPSLVASDGDCEGGAPVGLIEMAATGMPVVSTRHCDIPEVIEDGVGGLLADEGDVDELVAHLRELASCGDRWLELATAARTRIEQHYDLRRQSARLAEVYRSLL